MLSRSVPDKLNLYMVYVVWNYKDYERYNSFLIWLSWLLFQSITFKFAGIEKAQIP